MVDSVLPESYKTLKCFGNFTSRVAAASPTGCHLLYLRWVGARHWEILLQRPATPKLSLRLPDTENLLAALLTITYSRVIFHKRL